MMCVAESGTQVTNYMHLGGRRIHPFAKGSNAKDYTGSCITGVFNLLEYELTCTVILLFSLTFISKKHW